jgi:hypothetical protein
MTIGCGERLWESTLSLPLFMHRPCHRRERPPSAQSLDGAGFAAPPRRNAPLDADDMGYSMMT